METSKTMSQNRPFLFIGWFYKYLLDDKSSICSDDSWWHTGLYSSSYRGEPFASFLEGEVWLTRLSEYEELVPSVCIHLYLSSESRKSSSRFGVP
jgi:hypothetical protein